MVSVDDRGQNSRCTADKSPPVLGWRRWRVAQCLVQSAMPREFSFNDPLRVDLGLSIRRERLRLAASRNRAGNPA